MPANSARYASRALTVAAELVADDKRVKQLRGVLQTINDDLVGDNARKKLRPVYDADGVEITNQVFRPAELPDTHFMRFVVVEDHMPKGRERRGSILPTLLVWECNHDGDAREYLRKVQTAARAKDAILKFDDVFGSCKGYPSIATGERWVSWMIEHSIRANAFYCGYRGVPKTEVDAAGRVRNAIRTFLDHGGGREQLVGKSATEAHQLIRARISATPPPEPMKPGDTVAAMDPRPAFAAEEKRLLRMLNRLKIGALILLPVTLPLAVLLLVLVVIPLAVLLRLHEWLEQPYTYDRAVHTTPDLIAVEDRIVQNQLTHIVDIKPGPFRYFLQLVVLEAIDLLARIHYVNGHLGHITSIHFGRWVVLKDRRWWRFYWRRDRLIFFSNYDFSWDSYLGEFVDRQATGLTAVWSNTQGFPHTRWLIKQGATDEERFKQWARDHQIPSQVWWSGVRDSSVGNVNDDVEIHRGAVAPAPPTDPERWLRRL